MHRPLVDPMLPQPMRVAEVHRDTRDTVTLALEPPSGEFRFRPGQFNMLYAFGIGEVPISISGDPTVPGRLVHTTRAVGAVSSAICRLESGEVLGVRGPFGTGWPVAEAAGRDLLIIAGGIGLAPLRPVLCQVLAERDRFARVALLYGARTPEDILFGPELRLWRSRLDLDVEVTVDRAPLDWRGNVGVVTTLVARASFDAPDAVAMLCGPEVMMRFAIRELEHRGLQRQNIYLSMERNMKCAVGFCGHCQLGPSFVCKDGPVFRHDRIEAIFGRREI